MTLFRFLRRYCEPWTTEAPTVAGYFWFWFPAALLPVLVQLVWTTRGRHDVGLDCRYIGSEETQRVEDMDGRWKGPVRA